MGASESDLGAFKKVDGVGSIALVEAAAAAGVGQFVLVTSLGTGKIGFPACESWWAAAGGGGWAGLGTSRCCCCCCCCCCCWKGLQNRLPEPWACVPLALPADS